MSAIGLIGWFFVGSAVFAGFVITAALFAKLLLRLPNRNNEFNEEVLKHYRIAEARLAESANHHDRIASALESALIDAHAEWAREKQRRAQVKP
jgi:hypothetical protein